MDSVVTPRERPSLDLAPYKPLVICDVDEVILHFLRELEAFLEEEGLWLDPASFALNGNIRRRSDGEPLHANELGPVLMRCFAARTRHMQLIEGAKEALHELSGVAQVVLLSNLPARFAEDRRINLAGHGIDLPYLSNDGPKGPVVLEMAEGMAAPVFFIDDSPSNLQSVAEHLPDAHIIHFLQDGRFGRHVGLFDYVSLRTDNWAEAKSHILGLISA
ncbi:MAG: hypothetical protein AB7S41_06125 [Parvibaculaceae bacterium]